MTAPLYEKSRIDGRKAAGHNYGFRLKRKNLYRRIIPTALFFTMKIAGFAQIQTS